MTVKSKVLNLAYKIAYKAENQLIYNLLTYFSLYDIEILKFLTSFAQKWLKMKKRNFLLFYNTCYNFFKKWLRELIYYIIGWGSLKTVHEHHFLEELASCPKGRWRFSVEGAVASQHYEARFSIF